VPFEPSCGTDTMQPAMAALFGAEQSRATGAGDPVAAWRDAATACERAGMRWEQHQSLQRLGAELVRDHGSRLEAAEVLRTAYRYALEQGVNPLLHRVEEAAALGQISLTAPATPHQEDTPAAFAALTPRETEILSYLVARRTNPEIAAELFISEKTVSVHVSNLLRKTATGSRWEVAALAVRLGWGTSQTTS